MHTQFIELLSMEAEVVRLRMRRRGVKGGCWVKEFKEDQVRKLSKGARGWEVRVAMC